MIKVFQFIYSNFNTILLMHGSYLFTEEFTRCLDQNKAPDIFYVKQHILSAFNKENNKTYKSLDFLTEEQEDEVVQWLNLCIIYNPKSHLLYIHKAIVKIPKISISLSSKINILAQYHCPLCTSNSQYGVYIIPIRIASISKQASNPTIKKAFEKAIASRFSGKEIPFKKGSKLCVQLIFVFAPSSKDKDLDNMSKALMDALQNNLFEKDIDVDHLSLLKIKTFEEDEYIYISIRKTDLNAHKLVLFKKNHHTWNGRPFLDLKDFIE